MRYVIKTAGLMCGHCEANVETHLLEVPGVTDAEADHETNTVEVACSDDVTPEQLRAAVAAASKKYQVLEIAAA